MITITNTVLSDFNQRSQSVPSQEVNTYLATIGKAEKDLEKSATAIALIDKQPLDTKTLSIIAMNQKQIVLSMVSSNPEDAIALALAASIEEYGKQLEEIQTWNNGGSAVIEPMLDMIYESILQGGVDGTEYEDLMQLLVTDLLMNVNEWNLDLSVLFGSDYQIRFAQITEHFGSGLHAPYGQYDNYPPEDIVDWFLNTCVDNLTPLVGSSIPADSLTGQIVMFFNEPNNRNGLKTCATNYWTDPNGFINGSNNITPDNCERLCPTLKIVILADAAEKKTVTADDWNKLLMGNVSDFEVLLGLNDGELGQYLMSMNGWIPSPGAYTNNAGAHIEIDRYPDFSASAGIYPNDLIKSLNNFPGRELTEEEIKEVNRIGDQVKMLHQTLKYWLQICRDEQLAIARNIS